MIFIAQMECFVIYNKKCHLFYRNIVIKNAFALAAYLKLSNVFCYYIINYPNTIYVFEFI